MVNVYVYVTKLPPRVYEMVTPCYDGYTVYLSDVLDLPHLRRAYNHALRHIYHDDLDKTNVQDIEKEAHDVDSKNSE